VNANESGKVLISAAQTTTAVVDEHCDVFVKHSSLDVRTITHNRVSELALLVYNNLFAISI
jgi:hypothetical protein